MRVNSNWEIKIGNIVIGFMFFVTAAVANQVIDVGKYEIQGSIRGPEVQFIDSDRMSDDATNRLVRQRLKQMEGELLQPENPPATEVKKK